MIAWLRQNTKTLAGSLLAAFCFGSSFALITDRLVLPYLESNHGFAGRQWKEENKKRFVFNCQRNSATNGAPVWRSWGLDFDKKQLFRHRILVMGDSFVWGDSYANMNDMWWRQLQKELARRGYEVEVIGAGRPGYSLSQELKCAPALVAKYKPDLIIWGYDSNDCDEGVLLGFTFQRPKFFSCPDKMFYKAVPNLHERISSKLQDALSGIIGATKNLGSSYSEWELKLLEGKNFELFQKTVADVASFHRTSGVPGFVLTLPQVPEQEHFRRRFGPISTIMAANGIEFVDVAPAFARAYGATSGRLVTDSGTVRPRSWGINPANPHPNACATHFFAVKAADYLCQHYAERLGPKQSSLPEEPLRINDSMPAVVVVPDTESPGALAFAYPPFDELLLAEPGKASYLQLSLAVPHNLRSVSISGPDLTGADLSISRENRALGYDEGKVQLIGSQSGQHLHWDVDPEQPGSADPVSTLRLTARFKGNDKTLHLKLEPGQRQLLTQR